MGFEMKSCQVLMGVACQLTHSDTSSVTLPSQPNCRESKVAPLSSSGLMPVVRAKVPMVVPSFGAAVKR